MGMHAVYRNGLSWSYIMSKLEFIELCGFYSIDPQIALESVELCEALRSRDAVEARRILREDF